MSMYNVAYLGLILLNKYGNMFNKLFLAYVSIVIIKIWGIKVFHNMPFHSYHENLLRWVFTLLSTARVRSGQSPTCCLEMGLNIRVYNSLAFYQRIPTFQNKSINKNKLEDRSQKKKIMFLHSKNKASRKGYKGEC